MNLFDYLPSIVQKGKSKALVIGELSIGRHECDSQTKLHSIDGLIEVKDRQFDIIVFTDTHRLKREELQQAIQQFKTIGPKHIVFSIDEGNKSEVPTKKKKKPYERNALFNTYLSEIKNQFDGEYAVIAHRFLNVIVVVNN